MQDGTEARDEFSEVVAGADGSIIMSGHTDGGSFSETSLGNYESVAVKLDANGNELRRWQVKCEAPELRAYLAAAST